MKILLTGSTGYIGRRLLPLLLQQNHQVYCLVRDPQRLDLDLGQFPNLHIVQGDLMDSASLAALPKDIDAAYFLVHAMSAGKDSFESKEVTMAENFVEYFNTTRAKQVIYLSGIVNDEKLSPHLSSRKKVEDVLQGCHAAVTVLRAAIIVGSGSASFEIIRDLVEKLPVMVAPSWLKTRCQPIAVRDVLGYLTGVLGNEKTYGEVFDIGGPDILTYKEILLSYARVRGYRRYILTLPVLSPRISSYWLYFVTTTTYSLAQHLVDSMRNEVVCQEHRIRELVPLRLHTFAEAVQLAFRRIEQNEVVSSWTDALSSTNMDRRFLQYVRVPKFGCFRDEQIRYFDRPMEEVLENVWHIGGERGWYYGNFLWRLRGALDKIVGGVGLRRGRRNPSELFPGDALDFWRVIFADKAHRHLFLFAEMKLPGDAWLEFQFGEDEKGSFLKQTATFRPKGISGRLYWYLVLPFHFLIFPGMLRNLVRYR